ncbi:MAG: HEAT repeat domain-containing protein, partial [Anaerolineae bacterium]|nr:HEAT repeat domain-containing protein [Anaerolineae bacterium]
GEFAGLFIQGNPIYALEAMVRYYRSKDERRAVVMTERLGQTNSPLTVEELLEALSDPRFHVRFEAIISISRMRPPHYRLVNALVQILEGTEVSLSVVAAWALGRIGDKDGIPALRRGLNSHYRSIQAHCARALGNLRDFEMTPEILRRLESETDKGLQMAYASALGNLQAKDAVDLLLPLVKATDNDGARLELALSLARMIGDEQRFIRLWRQSKHDVGTMSSQTILALRHHFGRDRTELEQVIEATAETMAHANMNDGALLLSQLIRLLPQDQYDPASLKILNECADRLREFGAERVEYLLLTLHNLEAGRI